MDSEFMDLELPRHRPFSPEEIVDTLLGFADAAVKRHGAGELRWLRCQCLGALPNTPERALLLGVIDRRIREATEPFLPGEA